MSILCADIGTSSLKTALVNVQGHLNIFNNTVFVVFADEAYAYDEEYYSKFKDDNLTLYVYNWGEYISDGSDGAMDVIKEFEELTGIEVEYTTFDTNEGLYSKLQSGSAYYDIIIPSDYMISRMAQNVYSSQSEGVSQPKICLYSPSTVAMILGA